MSAACQCIHQNHSPTDEGANSQNTSLYGWDFTTNQWLAISSPNGEDGASPNTTELNQTYGSNFNLIDKYAQSRKVKCEDDTEQVLYCRSPIENSNGIPGCEVCDSSTPPYTNMWLPLDDGSGDYVCFPFNGYFHTGETRGQYLSSINFCEGTHSGANKCAFCDDFPDNNAWLSVYSLFVDQGFMNVFLDDSPSDDYNFCNAVTAYDASNSPYWLGTAQPADTYQNCKWVQGMDLDYLEWLNNDGGIDDTENQGTIGEDCRLYKPWRLNSPDSIGNGSNMNEDLDYGPPYLWPSSHENYNYPLYIKGTDSEN